MRYTLILKAILISVVLGNAAVAATRTVDRTDDDPTRTACTASNNDCSFRGAISGAASGDTINFSGTVFATSQNLNLSTGNGEIVISKNLIITGPGANLVNLSGVAQMRTLIVSGAFSLTLSGITISFARDFGSSGAAISANDPGSTLNISNVVLSNNRTSAIGGAIFTNGNLTISNSTLNSNLSSGDGGAIAVGGRLAVSGCSFSSNNSQTRGGAIWAILNAGSNTITNSTFNGNSTGAAATAGGGSIYNGGSLLTVTGSSFTGTQGAGNGGAIYAAGDMSITDSVISGNQGWIGAAIYNFNSTVTLNRTTVSGNSATSEGGAFYMAGTLNIYNSTVSGNTAGNYGGAASGNAGGTWTNVTVTNNRATNSYGGGIYRQGTGLFQIRNTIIAGNSAGNDGQDIYGDTVTSLGHNIIGNNNPSPITAGTGDILGVDPQLGTLGNYGGTLLTHAISNGSPAVNHGDNCVLTANGCGDGNPALLTDERGSGAPRSIGGMVDIGAFEKNITFAAIPFNSGINFAYSFQYSATRQSSLSALASKAEIANIAPTVFSVLPIAGEGLPPGLNLSSGGLLNGTPTTPGTYTFTVKVVDTDGMAGIQRSTVSNFVPTAAGVAVSGMILTPDGAGVRGAIVVLTDSNGISRTATSSTFGYFRFDNVPSGQTYSATVVSKRLQFSPQIVSVSDNVADLIFTADQ